jgi:hypothetical protein
VVAALNEDMPFDRFTIEQLAGDLLRNPTLSQKIATGFNRSAPTNVEAGSDPEETRVNQVLDRVNTLGTVWLGSTLECAQCHDHKYDAFTQKDYYSLFAFFNNTSLEADRTNPKVPGSIQFNGPQIRLDESLTNSKRAELESKIQMLESGNAPEKEKLIARLRKQLESLEGSSTLVMQEDTPRSSAIFKRGDFRARGDEVFPAVPAFLNPLPGVNPKPDQPVESHRPNRLDLARWLVARENPLTARVTVNRWWSELFGQGLVSTPEDFGVKGEHPTHPELLDWLASELMERGWSMKHLLRCILTSRTYRQSSHLTPSLRERDDRNLLLARGPRFRLDAELIRDNALSIAGLLNPKLGGEPIRPPQPKGLWTKVGGKAYNYETSPGSEQYRRGLFVVLKRASPYPSFVNFDANSRMACRVKRTRSNTPLQALTLLNDPVYVQAANAFTQRILASASNDAGRIEAAFCIALARAPEPLEQQTMSALLNALRAHVPSTSQESLQASIEEPRSSTNADLETHAWRGVATALLNLDETITKP